MRDVDADFRTVIVDPPRRGVRRSSASSPASGSRSAAATPATRRSCRSTTSRAKGSTLDEPRARPLRHRPRQARRHRRLRAARRRGGRARRRRRGRARRRDVGRAARRGPPGGRPSSRSPGAARPTTTATSRRCRRSTRRVQRVERGAAGDELRRPDAAPGDGPRGREALAARPTRHGYARPDRGDATSRATSREHAPRCDGGDARARRRARGARLGRARRRCRPGDELDVVIDVARGRARARRPGRASPGTRSSTSDGERAGRRRFVVRAAPRPARARARPTPSPGGPSRPCCATAASRRPSCGASPAPAPATPTRRPASSRSARLPERGAPRLRLARSASATALWTDKLAELAERAAARAVGRDRATSRGRRRSGCKPDVERAVAQVMTYIAQNEYAALLRPGRATCRRSTRATSRC